MSIRCSFSHQGFTLIGRSSIIFAICLIIIYSDSFWFAYNAANFGVLTVAMSLVITHFILLVLETKKGTYIFSPLWKGKPVVLYTKWLETDENSISFGLYRILWTAIDDVSLSRFGNIIFKSNAIAGTPSNDKKQYPNPANTILGLSFTAIDLKSQKEFITLLKEKCPQAKISESLIKILNKPDINSMIYIHIFTLIVFLGIIGDVGNSTFTYIELLKRYYLSHKSALDGSLEQAQKYYDSAEQLRTHPVPSIISPKLLNNNSTAASIAESRSKYLWDAGKKAEALALQKEAINYSPKSFKVNLRLARMYAALGQTAQAKTIIETLIKNHKHALLPQLYLASFYLKDNQTEKAKSILENYLQFLCKGEEKEAPYFTPPPVWPPIGEDALHEIFYQEDLEFLLPSKQPLFK